MTFVDRPAGCGYHRRYLAGCAVIAVATRLPRFARNDRNLTVSMTTIGRRDCRASLAMTKATPLR